MRGILRRHVAFDGRWADVRACVHVDGGRVAHRTPRRAARRARAATCCRPGPLLVRDGERAFDRAADAEGFRAGATSSTPTSPRSAIRAPRSRSPTAGCWRSCATAARRADAGLTLGELADVLVDLGAREAMNLDGGGSTTLIAGGRLRNRPRADVGVPEPGGRAVATALLFLPRP